MAVTKSQQLSRILRQPTLLPLKREVDKYDMSVTARVTGTLHRLRQGHPLPVAVPTLEAVLYPDWARELTRQMANATELNRENRNAVEMLGIKFGSRMTYVTIGRKQAFWFQHEFIVAGSGDDLVEDNVCRLPSGGIREVLQHWYNKAKEVEDNIDAVERVLSPVMRNEVHATVVAEEWPQLQSVLRSQPTRMSIKSPAAKEMREYLKGITPQVRDLISTTFASALMLPSTFKLDAWVGLHHSGLSGGR